MFPIDPMNVANAASGPTSACSTRCRKPGLPSWPAPTKSVWKNDRGTNVAMTPPTVTSFQTMPHSMK